MNANEFSCRLVRVWCGISNKRVCSMTNILHADESRLIVGIIFEVRNEMGGGWCEEIYHRALVENLRFHGVQIMSKPRLPLCHRGVKVHKFEPDIVALGKIVLELKVLPRFTGECFPSIYEAQVFHYLKRTKCDLGILVNFAHSKVGMKRLAYQPPPVTIAEEYERIVPLCSEGDKAILREVRHHILAIAKQYGTGYPETIYRRIVQIELEHQGIKCVSDVEVPADWKGKPLGIQTTQHLLIADRFLIQVRAVSSSPSTLDYIRTRTYMANLGLKIGLVVNFSHNVLQIYGTAV